MAGTLSAEPILPCLAARPMVKGSICVCFVELLAGVLSDEPLLLCLAAKVFRKVSSTASFESSQI